MGTLMPGMEMRLSNANWSSEEELAGMDCVLEKRRVTSTSIAIPGRRRTASQSVPHSPLYHRHRHPEQPSPSPEPPPSSPASPPSLHMISEPAPQPVGGEEIKHQLLIAHLTNATGCSPAQAAQLLQASRWEFELALSLFFQDPGMSSPSSALYPPASRHPNSLSPMEPPCNTPATPPSFPDALLGLSKMAATDWGLAATSPRDVPHVLVASNSHNYLPTTNDRFEQSCDWASSMNTDAVSPQVPKETQHSGMLMSENSEPSGTGNQAILFSVDGSAP